MELKFGQYLSKPIGSVTWNVNWINEYESPWSIFEKFKVANYTDKKDIFKCFGTEKIRSLKNIIGGKHHDLYNLTAFDDQNFQSLLGFNLKSYTLSLIQNLSGFLNDNEFHHKKHGRGYSNYWKESFTFCIECLEEGYHSTLHQFAMFNKCPFHNSPLYSACPKCNDSIIYELSDHHFISPYVCKCGFRFSAINSVHTLPRDSKNSPYIIQNPDVKRWIDLTASQQNEMGSIIFDPQTRLDDKPEILKILLTSFDNASGEDNSNEWIVSSNNIQNIKNPEAIFLSDEKKYFPITHFMYTNIYTISPSVRFILHEFFHVRNQTISAIGKHLRKTILKDHKKCIARYVNMSKVPNQSAPPICPYAYAYVLWKQTVMKIDHYYNVDRKPLAKHKTNFNDLSLVGLKEHDHLIESLNFSIKKIPIQNPEFITHYKWLISHVTGHSALKIFSSCLKSVSEKDEKTESDSNIMEQKRSIFIMKLPRDEHQPIQVISQSIDYLTEELHCPFPSVKLKRKKKEEVSHLPMVVAIDKFNRAEKEDYDKWVKSKSLES